ncbi:Piwi domain-containing protein [Pseudanabaena sp. ABRG5-3]|uniref:Piwi domain-containing protein n=1 Tax=Pseudanabaena sp. ABRG5-3 TaxID=685565 RepID=UPI000DC73E0F|nr:Piwi domain-containing protein [Pseudanabaena sp. ABRG5-3]BBC24228.1 stem cell self-renewal protein Piwi [Pseudanabaena sp. ABRG5-3]
MTTFIEVFPINLSTLPTLYAYKLIIGNNDISTIGWKFAYRLRAELGGHWVWSENKIVGDKLVSDLEIKNIVEVLWQEQPEVYRNLQGLKQDTDFAITPQSQADFVAFGLFSDIQREIKLKLSQKNHDLGRAKIERTYGVKAWVVNDHPSISISVQSNLIYKEDFKTYAAKVADPNQLLGIMVEDKGSSLKDEIAAITGRLIDHRTRLLSLTKKEESKALINNAPDDELVVSVGKSRYDYISSALKIVLRLADCQRFNVDSQKALNILKIEPKLRSEIVSSIAEIAKQRNFIQNAYTSQKDSDLFLNSDSLNFSSNLCFGNSKIGKHDEMINSLKQNGVYRRSSKFSENQPIYIGIIRGSNTESLEKFRPALQEELKKFKFNSEYVGLQNIQEDSRVKIEEAINILMQKEKQPNIILAFFNDNSEEEGSAYDKFKSITIGRCIPSQYIEKSTTTNTFALGNIALGILGKTGNTPFALAEPLPYADLVIGLDVARQKKKNLSGSLNATAIARIYFSNGDLLRYRIHDAPLEGETIPENVLQSLFPIDEFQGKRVVIHRDGLFRGKEKQVLKSWAKQISAEFYLVEVIKDAVPRIYSFTNGEVKQPAKGDVFKLSDTQAFLVSSLPPFKNSTPQPLQIRTEAPFTIEQAVHSVLSLTLLHYGSLRGTRSPVSIHFSDKIGGLVLKGIKPKDLEGTIPYWL